MAQAGRREHRLRPLGCKIQGKGNGPAAHFSRLVGGALPCPHGCDLRGRMEEVRQHLWSSLAIKYMRRSAYSERCKNDVVLATHRDRDVARSLGLFLLDLGVPLDPCEIDGVEHLLQVNTGGG